MIADLVGKHDRIRAVPKAGTAVSNRHVRPLSPLHAECIRYRKWRTKRREIQKLWISVGRLFANV